MLNVLMFSMPDVTPLWALSAKYTFLHGPWPGGTSIAGNCPNHNLFLADLVVKRNNLRAGIKDAIKKSRPDIIGFSSMTFQYPTAIKIAKHIRKYYPELKNTAFILGGYHATSLGKKLTEETDAQIFDYIFVGESELSFNTFLDIFDNKQWDKLNTVTGLSYKTEKGWLHNERHGSINLNEGLSILSPADRTKRLWKEYSWLGRKFDIMESSRGCDYACKFCSIRTMMPGSRFSRFNFDKIINEIKDISSRKTKIIFFTDDNPSLDPENFKVLLKEIIHHKLNKIYYSGMVSTKSMQDKQLTDLMAKAGWKFVLLGIENIYDNNLKNMRKVSTKEMAEKAISNLHESGISVLAGIIVGCPDDTEETIRGLFKWLRTQPIDYLGHQFITPYPGTVSREELLNEGLIINKDDWSKYCGEFAICKTRSGLMPEDLEAIVYEEVIKTHKVIFKNTLKSSRLKNDRIHYVGIILRVALDGIIKKLKYSGLSPQEIAKKERQRKIRINQFNI